MIDPSTSDTSYESLGDNTTFANGTLTAFNSSSDGIPISPVDNSFPLHKFLWRIGIIFAISGLVILGSFVAMYGFAYTRRTSVFRRRRRRAAQTLAFENQLCVTHDEADPDDIGHTGDDGDLAVHSSCGRVRRWSHDANATHPRSRSNSRSRSLSPGKSGRRKAARPKSPTELEDETIAGLNKLDNARLAFKEDVARYVEYDSTKDRETIGV